MSTVSPLLEVERAVQERAKEVALDMAMPEGATRLRALVDEEVARWSQDYKRGLRPVDIADAAVVAERAYRNVAGYGPLEPLLADDDVWEIMVNGPDAILRQEAQGPERLSRRGVPRRRARGADPHQDPRRGHRLAPQAGRGRGPP
ncbi:MAG TPA: hypothetical protein VM242_11605, partial [Acidimicrobiales bacterium]|nr:hypothetical protein [Acidimicrobiales bacterium]